MEKKREMEDQGGQKEEKLQKTCSDVGSDFEWLTGHVLNRKWSHFASWSHELVNKFNINYECIDFWLLSCVLTKNPSCYVTLYFFMLFGCSWIKPIPLSPTFHFYIVLFWAFHKCSGSNKTMIKNCIRSPNDPVLFMKACWHRLQEHSTKTE